MHIYLTIPFHFLNDDRTPVVDERLKERKLGKQFPGITK